MVEISKNSALFWLPRLVDVGLPVPRTEVVRFNPEDLYPLLDGESPRPGFDLAAVGAAVERIGVPSFLRTDLASAKHDGPSAYRIGVCSDPTIMTVIYATLESVCSRMMEAPPQAFLVREWLSLRSYFTAFDGHRIAREWRVLVEGGDVRIGFYWPRESFERSLDDEVPELDRLYAQLVAPPTPQEHQMLETLALTAVAAMAGGDWSVDFAEDENGKLWLIDMALAEASWHPTTFI